MNCAMADLWLGYSKRDRLANFLLRRVDVLTNQPSNEVSEFWYFADHASQYIYLNFNHLDALNFIMSLFHASTCFEHMCSSSGDQNCIIQPLVSSHWNKWVFFYVFFWVFPRRLIVVCRRFGTLYLFHLHRLDMKYTSYFISSLWRWNW